MFILNQVVGIGDFSIMDNLRLIVIVAIFIGIIVVLLYLKSAKSGRKIEKKYMQATNPYDSSSKEERHSADVVDDFMSIEEGITEKKGDAFENTTESEVVIKADLEDREGKIDTKREAGIKDIRAEFTIIIEGLISKIEEREKEVVNTVENVVDAKVQEVLSKINDRIDEVIQVQKNSTALVLEKMIDFLRQKEGPVGIKSSKKSKEVVDKKIEFEEVTERDIEVPDEDGDIMGRLDSALQGASVGISFSDKSGDTAEVAEVPEKAKEEGLEVPFEAKEDVKAEPTVSLEAIEKNVLEVDEGDSADFDIQEFLEELGNLPSEKDPDAGK